MNLPTILQQLCTSVQMLGGIDQVGLYESVRQYLRSIWNLLDMICLILVIVGLPLFNMNEIFKSAWLYETGRVCMIFSLLVYIIRLLNIFTVHKEIGPKLLMLGRMVHTTLFLDLLIFRLCRLLNLVRKTIYILSSLSILIEDHWRH